MSLPSVAVVGIGFAAAVVPAFGVVVCCKGVVVGVSSVGVGVVDMGVGVGVGEVVGVVGVVLIGVVEIGVVEIGVVEIGVVLGVVGMGGAAVEEEKSVHNLN